jgi:class 3 adenylate cyclase
LAQVGVRPPDPDDLRVRKEVLTLSAALMATASFAWVGTYAVLGLWLPVAIPFVYQLASAASIYAFARTGDFGLFRRSQLWMSLLLPFALQWSLGGFENSSAVALWAFTSPLGALLFVGPREAIPWFVAFVALLGVSVGIDPALSVPDVPGGVILAFFGLTILGVTGTTYVLLQYFVRDRERERARSERLLLNVLPAPVAARLKREEGVIADAHDSVTVLFADLVGFTPLAESLPPSEVVMLLDDVFARWDAVAARHGVEKIKTIGDAYMVAAGVPLPRENHAEAIADTALEMLAEAERCGAESGVPFEIRIGIDTGPVVAGVIGRSKFIYDLWGDTVNTASRMESHAPRGGIQVTERAYAHLQQAYVLEPRGPIEVKGKGTMTPYLLLERRSARAEAAR